MQQRFSDTVHFSNFHTTYFPHPGCIAEGVVLVRPDLPNGPPLTTAERMTVESRYTDILFRPGFVARIRLDKLQNEKVDLHGTLKTESNFTKMSGGGVKSILLKPFDSFFKKEPVGAEIPVKLVGTYSDVHPGLDLVGKKK